jgi:hypothetical protein
MRWLILLGLVSLVGSVSCRREGAPILPTPAADNSEYVDLAAGESLSITVPLLRSGKYVSKFESVREQGTTITLAASDLIGFRVCRYGLEGRPDGRVSLKILSVDTTINGKTSRDKRVFAPPFPLPKGAEYVRLVYFVRSSQADHNMAIVSVKDRDAIEGFTKRLKADPGVCSEGGAVSCVWVPAGIAVRPE